MLRRRRNEMKGTKIQEDRKEQVRERVNGDKKRQRRIRKEGLEALERRRENREAEKNKNEWLKRRRGRQRLNKKKGKERGLEEEEEEEKGATAFVRLLTCYLCPIRRFFRFYHFISIIKSSCSPLILSHTEIDRHTHSIAIARTHTQVRSR